MSRDILTVYEATVRNFDPTTGVATVVMPGPYGMEPIEAPPFAHGIIIPANVEQLVVGDRVLVTQSENQPPEWISANSDWMARADAHNDLLYVKKPGDTMSGPLLFDAPTYGPVGSVGMDPTTFMMKLESSLATDILLQAGPGGLVYLNGGNTVGPSVDFNSMDFPGTHVLNFGSATRQMLNLYSTSYALGVQGSTWYARSGGHFAFYMNGVHSGTPLDPGAGGVVRLVIRNDGVIESFLRMQGVMRPQTAMGVWGSGSAYVALYDNTTDPDALGTRTGYVGFSGVVGSSNHLYLNNENGVDTRIYSGSGIVLLGVGSTERARINGQAVLFGKTTYNTFSTVGGVEFWHSDGQFFTTQATATYNAIVHISAADANASSFLRFYRGTSMLGNISQLSTTGVNYGDTSHGPWKGNVTDLDDDEALHRLSLWRPVAFQWKFDEDGNQSEFGTPSGDWRHGFIAQELYETQPTAVAKGYGTEGEQKVWLERKTNHQAAQALALENDEEPLSEFTELDPFMPWQVDNSKLVPDMVAAMQAILRKVEAQDDEIAELRDEVAALRSPPADEGR